MAELRLQKIIAQAGLASRRCAEQFITDGRVRVNGNLVTALGSKADPTKDSIEVEGFGTLSKQPLVYIALHKPVHVISTVRDPERRRTVVELLQETRAVGKRSFEGELPRVFPVGRLDFDAEGLILMTNDGDLSNKLMHPKGHVPKTYMVKVRGRVDATAIERMAHGVRLRREDGTAERRRTLPADVRIYKEGKANTWVEMILVEGRNHQVKRMCDAVGLQVIRLIRTEFAGIHVDPLPAGAWRFLTEDEITTLRNWRG